MNTIFKRYIPHILNSMNTIFGFPVGIVEVVVRMVAIKDIPRSYESVTGVIGFRGKIIPVIDLRKTLGLQKRHIYVNDHIVIIDHHEGHFAVIVDQIMEVKSIKADMMIHLEECFRK